MSYSSSNESLPKPLLEAMPLRLVTHPDGNEKVLPIKLWSFTKEGENDKCRTIYQVVGGTSETIKDGQFARWDRATSMDDSMILMPESFNATFRDEAEATHGGFADVLVDPSELGFSVDSTVQVDVWSASSFRQVYEATRTQQAEEGWSTKTLANRSDSRSITASHLTAIDGAKIASMEVPPAIHLCFCLIQLILAEEDQFDALSCAEMEGAFGPWLLHCEASVENAQFRAWFDASPTAACSTDSLMSLSSASDILGAVQGFENQRYAASRILDVPAEWSNEQFPLPDKQEAQQHLNAFAVAANGPQLVWLQIVQGPTEVNAHRAIRPRTQQELDLYGPVMTHFELNALLLSAAREVSQLDLEVTRRTFYMTQESLFHILDTLANPGDVLFSDDVKQYLTFPPEEMREGDSIFVLLSYTTRATEEEARECLENNGIPLGHSISAHFQPLQLEAETAGGPAPSVGLRQLLLFDPMGATLPSRAAQGDLQLRVGNSVVVTLNQGNTFPQFFTCTAAWEHNCVTVAEELSGQPLVAQPVAATVAGGNAAPDASQTAARRFHMYYRKNNCGSLLMGQYFHLALGREESWQESIRLRAIRAKPARCQLEPVKLPPFGDRDPRLAGERLTAIAPTLQSPSTTSSVCWCITRTMTTHVQLYGELFLTPDFLVFHGQGNPGNNGDTDDAPVLEVFSISEVSLIRLNDHNSLDGAWMVDSTDQDHHQYEITIQIPQGSVAFHTFATLAEYNALRIHWMRAKPMHLYSPELLLGTTPASFGQYVRQLLVLAFGDRDNAPGDFEDDSHQEDFVDSLVAFLPTQQPVVVAQVAGRGGDPDPRHMVGAGATQQPSAGSDDSMPVPKGDVCRICSMRVCTTLRRTHLADPSHVRFIQLLNEGHSAHHQAQQGGEGDSKLPAPTTPAAITSLTKEVTPETKEQRREAKKLARAAGIKPFCDTCGMPVPEMMFYSHMQVCHKDSYFHLNGFQFDPISSRREKLLPLVNALVERRNLDEEEEKTRLARKEYEKRRRAGAAEQWQPQTAGGPPLVQPSGAVKIRDGSSSKYSDCDSFSTGAGGGGMTASSSTFSLVPTIAHQPHGGLLSSGVSSPTRSGAGAENFPNIGGSLITGGSSHPTIAHEATKASSRLTLDVVSQIKSIHDDYEEEEDGAWQLGPLLEEEEEEVRRSNNTKSNEVSPDRDRAANKQAFEYPDC